MSPCCTCHDVEYSKLWTYTRQAGSLSRRCPVVADPRPLHTRAAACTGVKPLPRLAVIFESEWCTACRSVSTTDTTAKQTLTDIPCIRAVLRSALAHIAVGPVTTTRLVISFEAIVVKSCHVRNCAVIRSGSAAGSNAKVTSSTLLSHMILGHMMACCDTIISPALHAARLQELSCVARKC